MSLYSHSQPTSSPSSTRKSVSIFQTMLKARSLAALDIGIMTNASITFAKMANLNTHHRRAVGVYSVNFVHGRHTGPSHLSTKSQLSVACTFLVPANIRATTRRYRKVRHTQVTLRHAIVWPRVIYRKRLSACEVWTKLHWKFVTLLGYKAKM